VTTLHDEGVDWRDAWCLWCGDVLPIERDPRRKYCDRACGFAYLNDLRRVQRAEARKGKTCWQCGVPFVAQKAHKRFCSHRCATRASELRNAEPRACGWCGSTFPAVTATSRYCSKSCSAKARCAERT
jgi:hypothetical protein